MAKHLGGGSGELDLERALRDHGVELEPVDLGLDEVWAAEVTVVRARLADEWRQAAGRLGPQSGTDLLRAADDDSQALLELVEPLVDHDVAYGATQCSPSTRMPRPAPLLLSSRALS